MSKSVYLIGSLRNPRVPQIANSLRRDCGFEVFDDWYGAGHEADDMWQRYEDSRGRNYRDALAGHAAQHIFHFDLKHITASDAVMLVLPAGKSGHLEFGYARGLGKPGVILMDGEPERFDVMYNFASLITTELDEAADFLRAWKRPKTAGSVVEELQAQLIAERLANSALISTLAQISYCDAQTGADALHMRGLATAIIHPERKP